MSDINIETLKRSRAAARLWLRKCEQEYLSAQRRFRDADKEFTDAVHAKGPKRGEIVRLGL
jgi:hypothetical protein